jgi:hypothetical protein
LLQLWALLKVTAQQLVTLNCSYHYYKRWAKIYDATEEGYANLFEQHLNQAGKGIKKWIGNHGKTPPLQDLINGIIPATSFSLLRLKNVYLKKVI